MGGSIPDGRPNKARFLCSLEMDRVIGGGGPCVAAAARVQGGFQGIGALRPKH